MVCIPAASRPSTTMHGNLSDWTTSTSRGVGTWLNSSMHAGSLSQFCTFTKFVHQLFIGPIIHVGEFSNQQANRTIVNAWYKVYKLLRCGHIGLAAYGKLSQSSQSRRLIWATHAFGFRYLNFFWSEINYIERIFGVFSDGSDKWPQA